MGLNPNFAAMAPDSHVAASKSQLLMVDSGGR